MISTITTSTVSAVTSGALAGSLVMIGVLVLLSLLIQKELVTTGTGNRAQRISRALNIAIVPLLIVFGMVVVNKIMEVLH